MGESLYLALPLEGDLFPVTSARASVDEAKILGWVRELLAVVGIVEELGLDTRIWSKSASA